MRDMRGGRREPRLWGTAQMSQLLFTPTPLPRSPQLPRHGAGGLQVEHKRESSVSSTDKKAKGPVSLVSG